MSNVILCSASSKVGVPRLYKSPDETFYYYHLARKAFDVILQKDSVSKRVIPEVSPYEE